MPGNLFPVTLTDMTPSLTPRTLKPAEHHASRMPGVLSATAVLLTLCLSACGGGGSGSGATDNQGAGKGTTPPLSVNPGQPRVKATTMVTVTAPAARPAATAPKARTAPAIQSPLAMSTIPARAVAAARIIPL